MDVILNIMRPQWRSLIGEMKNWVLIQSMMSYCVALSLKTLPFGTNLIFSAFLLSSPQPDVSTTSLIRLVFIFYRFYLFSVFLLGVLEVGFTSFHQPLSSMCLFSTFTSLLSFTLWILSQWVYHTRLHGVRGLHVLPLS